MVFEGHELAIKLHAKDVDVGEDFVVACQTPD